MSAFANFEVGCLIKKKKMKKWAVCHCSSVFTYFESFIVYKNMVMCLKRLITVPFESSELFHLLRLMGVWVRSLHIQSMGVWVRSLHIQSMY